MTRKTNADLQAEVQQLKQEIEMLKAQVEETESIHEAQKIQDRMDR